MRFSDLDKITGGNIIQLARDRNVSTLVTDSRKPIISDESVFFALRGERHDGHQYIAELYHLGIRQFVVENGADFKFFPEGNFIQVTSVLAALQAIAAEHRRSFSIPVIGITGSNGKTIIKEWLFQILSADKNVAKNPGSYNSQIGVPLSVWGLQPNHQLGIFEAGISLPGEMEKLEKVIRPTIGIFTNIGTAHDEGFATRTEKIEEKLKLFSRVDLLIYCADHSELHKVIQLKKIPSLTWGSSEKATIKIKQTTTGYELSY
ncbi:MAG: bifunctional UDP-N-acetylmuramoyl-tripeptide:D-alanyl-D-alanine ligase/alanine racemase, partial [Cytophagales bacterium]|nr:bifunctional UDP-N-acetylmuramoyl-tripeptide:D-alanyl-D-alanine ligase/alanine racemase [Cytophagales bacterium]